MSHAIFVIPGNPPAVYFYEEWKTEIERAYPGTRVFVSAYPILPFHRDHTKYLYEVAEHHKKQFLTFQESIGGRPITVVGHSLGGWMAVELLKGNFDLIDKCWLFHPFLTAPTWRGHLILETINHLQRMTRLKNVIIKSKPLVSRAVGILKHVKDSELRNAVDLAYHERVLIAHNQKLSALPNYLTPKLEVLYTTGDIWCPPAIAKELGRKVSTRKVDLSHGFIVSEKERLKAMDIICANAYDFSEMKQVSGPEL